MLNLCFMLVQYVYISMIMQIDLNIFSIEWVMVLIYG